MSYEKVLQANRYIVGTKQTVKALKLGLVTELLIAKDAEPRVTAKAIQAANELNIKVTHVESMAHLGKLCGIDVGASAVAITN